MGGGGDAVATRAFLPAAAGFRAIDLVGSLPGFSAQQAVAVDLDLDGDADAILVPSGGGAIAQFRQHDGRADVLVQPPSDQVIADGSRVVAGDLDLDGDTDLLLPSNKPIGTTVALNRFAETGVVGLHRADVISVPALGLTVEALLLDWDGDGDLDVVGVPADGTPWTFLENQVRPSGALSFVDVSTTMVSPGGATSLPGTQADAVVADLDGDGSPDIVAVGRGAGVVLENHVDASGVHSFVDTTNTRFPASGVGPTGTVVAAADFDLDGDAEVFVGGDDAATLWLNEGAGSFRNVTRESLLLSMTHPVGALTADLNFDGFPDLFVASGVATEAHRYFAMDGVVGAVPHFDDMAGPSGLCCPPQAAAPDVLLSKQLGTASLIVPAGGACQGKLYVTQAPDDDCDGMPNAFEAAHHLDPQNGADRLGDPDADGLTNLQEFQLGSPPDSLDGPHAGERARALGQVDVDGDGVPEGADNCPLITNAEQQDADGDRVGDLCDDDLFGSFSSISSSSAVVELRNVGTGDHWYVTENQLDAKAGALDPRMMLGYRTQQVRFRWFDVADTGLVRVMAAYDAARGRHHYTVESGVGTNDNRGAAPEPVGYVATGQTYGPFTNLVTLFQARSGSTGDEILTPDGNEAAALGRAGYSIRALGSVLPFEGERVSPVPVFRLEGGGAQLLSRLPPTESDAALRSGGTPVSVYPAQSPLTTAVYRVTDRLGQQVLTSSLAERTALLAAGGRDDGTLGYVFRTVPPNPFVEWTPVVRMRDVGGRYRYATSGGEVDAATAAGFATDAFVGLFPRGAAAPLACTQTATALATRPDPVAGLTATLRAIPDAAQRAYRTATVLESLCAAHRVLGGVHENAFENDLAARLANVDPVERSMVLGGVDTFMAQLTPDLRAELLGRFTHDLDPRDCATAVDPTLPGQIVLLGGGVAGSPLRAAQCDGGGAASIEHDVTTWDEEVRAPHLVVAGHLSPGLTAPAARPTLLGVDIADTAAVSRLGSPELIADWDAHRRLGEEVGDGLYAYGVPVDPATPCAGSTDLDDTCETTRGEICSSRVDPSIAPTCLAYPIMRDRLLRLRGYNFWDENPTTVWRPVGAPPVVRRYTALRTRETMSCLLPEPGLETYDLATAPFDGDITPGFWKVRLANQNGTYTTPFGSVSTPRTLHVCRSTYEAAPRDYETPPGGTPPRCNPPVPDDDCESTSLTCTAASPAWTTTPRPLSACAVADPLAPAACSETPAWFVSEPKRDPAETHGAAGREFIVYVPAAAPLPPPPTPGVTVDLGMRQALGVRTTASLFASDDILFLGTAIVAHPGVPDRPCTIGRTIAEAGFRSDTAKGFDPDIYRVAQCDRVFPEDSIGMTMGVVHKDDESGWVIFGTIFLDVLVAVVSAWTAVAGIGAGPAFVATSTAAAILFSDLIAAITGGLGTGITLYNLGTVSETTNLAAINDFTDRSHHRTGFLFSCPQPAAFDPPAFLTFPGPDNPPESNVLQSIVDFPPYPILRHAGGLTGFDCIAPNARGLSEPSGGACVSCFDPRFTGQAYLEVCIDPDCSRGSTLVDPTLRAGGTGFIETRRFKYDGTRAGPTNYVVSWEWRVVPRILP